MNFTSLILSLPSQNTTARMRAWRALKAAGAAVLRDGVYLLPDNDGHVVTLNAIAGDVRVEGGSAHVVAMTQAEGDDFTALFDRREDYAALMADIAGLRSELDKRPAEDIGKKLRKLRKTYDAMVLIDFFPSEAGAQVLAAIVDLERAADPDEPHAADNDIRYLNVSDFQGRVWATRQRPWVDRLASAWLIRRFIDPKARILWLESPDACPPEALGFDFDGAAFTHVGHRVTFETLVASFALEPPALRRLGGLVHFLDVGGVEPSEASGVETILAGMRAGIPNDDQLLTAATAVFDGLFAAFSTEKVTS